MDYETGRIVRLEKVLRVPESGSLSRKIRVTFIVYGLAFFSLMLFTSLLSNGSTSMFDAISPLIGIIFVLWGAGDSMSIGGFGALVRLSNFLFLTPVLAILTVISTYTESGSLGLVILAGSLAMLFGLCWIVRKTSAGT